MRLLSLPFASFFLFLMFPAKGQYHADELSWKKVLEMAEDRLRQESFYKDNLDRE